MAAARRTRFDTVDVQFRLSQGDVSQCNQIAGRSASFIRFKTVWPVRVVSKDIDRRARSV